MSGSAAHYSPALTAALAMTQQDINRMTEASKALQSWLVQIPVPSAASTNKEALGESSSKTFSNEKLQTHESATYLKNRESIHKLMEQEGGILTLHGMLLEAAKQCGNESIESFVTRMTASGASNEEAKAGLVIFHELDKSSKLKLVFEVLAEAAKNQGNIPASSAESSEEAAKSREQSDQGQQKENAVPLAHIAAARNTTPTSSASKHRTLGRQGALSLFHTILVAITCCIHDDKDNNNNVSLRPSVTKDDDVSSTEEPPKKVAKQQENDEASPNATSDNQDRSPASLQASSFESLSSPKDEPGSHKDHMYSAEGLSDELQQEIQETAKRAADQLIDYAIEKSSTDKNTANEDKEVVVTFEMFGDWYNSGGCTVVPWLELLHLNKWKVSSPPKKVPDVVPPHTSVATDKPPSSGTKQKIHSTPQQKSPHKPATSTVKSHPQGSSLSSMLKEDEEVMQKIGNASAVQHYPSRTVVSFDFSSSAEKDVARTSQPMCINISEENLFVLRGLVFRTGLIYRSAAEVCKTILRMSHKRIWDGRPLVTLRRDDFRHVIRTLIHPLHASASKTPQSRLSSTDLENFSAALEDFFACFEGNFHQSTTAYYPLSHDEVNVKELAVGVCFLCAGSKSTKLATGFELLDDTRSGFLTQQQLMRFLRSYLTMLVAISLLKESHFKKRQPLSHDCLQEMRAAVENGAHWTLGHFLRTARERHPKNHMRDAYSFEVFAEWYSKGGYAIAPWLELLDLNKLVSLIGEPESFAAIPQSRHRSVHPSTQPSFRECRSSHRRHHHNKASTPTAQVLFTFPLANQRNLIVLREDAVYVRGVVKQLGSLSFTADSIWTLLIDEVKKRPSLMADSKAKGKKGMDTEKNLRIDQAAFVEIMEAVLLSSSSVGRKRSADGISKLSSSVHELLANFFHSYDLKQNNMVSLNELMGGLILLCGGKKSSKLAFSFGVFDGRQTSNGKGKSKNANTYKSQSLDQGDMYLFLRSFLIVLFSCCCQTLDMSVSSVDRYIADTANMVAEDVMRYQWHTRKKDRVDFDEFGEWYNEGGFEIAPWLELLDLKKWVLVDNFDALDAQNAAAASSSAATLGSSAAAAASPARSVPAKLSPTQDPNCPPPPPEDVLDPSFFEDNDDHDIMQMDSIDEMDIMLMPSHDKDGDMLAESKYAFPPSEDKQFQDHQGQHDQQALKFHLASEDDDGGFMLSISQKRIRHLRQLLTETALHNVDPESACAKILSRASGSSKSKSKAPRTITKKEFEAAFREILGIINKKDDCPLLDVMSCIFAAFDVKQNGKPNALELACGFTVLCQGKKSDKLEYAFEVLDKSKNGHLSKESMFNYMRSFLTVLVSIACAPSLDSDDEDDKFTLMNGERCDKNTQSVIRAVEAGSKWAVAQAFRTGLHGRDGSDSISFDDFGQWYTQSGYTLIPWIELLDLSKWCV